MYDCARPKSVIFECKYNIQYADMYNEKTGELDIEGCGNRLEATCFFISFMLMVSFIFLNLFIAIILESFESSMDDERLQVGEATITKFQDFWSNDKFDPKGTKFIRIANFNDFLSMLVDEEIRMKILYDEKLMNNEISEEELLADRIFLFNIHFMIQSQYPSLYKERHSRIHKRMIDNKEIEQSTPAEENTSPPEQEKGNNSEEKNEVPVVAQEGGSRLSSARSKSDSE